MNELPKPTLLRYCLGKSLSGLYEKEDGIRILVWSDGSYSHIGCRQFFESTEIVEPGDFQAFELKSAGIISQGDCDAFYEAKRLKYEEAEAARELDQLAKLLKKYPGAKP